MNDYKENEWNREGDLLFTLKHDGWRSGVPQLVNRLMVRVETAKDIPADERENLIASLHQFLEEQRTKGSDNG